MAEERGGATALESGIVSEPTDMPSQWRDFVAREQWPRHWEFWLAVALAALLRLWHPEQSQFLSDQVGLMTLAREAVLRGALPLTGIQSSIGTLNPPLSIGVLLPTALFTKDPLPAVVLLALWNVLGVALLYIFTQHSFGRVTAAVAALLFATCGAAANYSRFLWQQNYLPPLLVLWAWTLYAGCIRGRRGWLAANLVLLVLITSLHPTGIVLAGVTLVALLLAPSRPAWREVALGAGLVVVLLLPTLLWEALSGGSDFTLLRQFSSRPSEINFDVFLAFAHLLSGPTYPTDYGGAPFAFVNSTAAYSRLQGLFGVVVQLAYLLYLAGYATVTALVLLPAVRRWREGGFEGTRWQQAQGLLVAIWRGLRAEASWRGYLLLWLWLTLPALALLRHNKTVQPHYLFIVYPAVFLAAGIAIQRALAIGPVLSAFVKRIRPSVRAPKLYPAVVPGALFVLVSVLVLGQAAQSLLYTAAQAAGQADNTTYGYPLGDLRNADVALSRVQQEMGARGILLSTPQPYFSSALDYMLVREHPDRTGFFGTCLLLPAQDAGPALVVSTQASSPAARLIPQLTGARLVQTIAMPGVEPFQVYELQGAAPLPGETRLTPAIYRGPGGERIQLEAAALEAPGVLRLRWTVLDGTPTGGTPSIFHFQLRATGAASGNPLAQGECAPTRWQTGQTLYTWVRTNDAGSTNSASTAALPRAPLALDVTGETTELWQRTLGPLRVISGASAGAPLARIAGQPAAIPSGPTRPGQLDATGAYVVPIGELSHS